MDTPDVLSENFDDWVTEYWDHLINMYQWIYEPRTTDCNFEDFMELMYEMSHL